MHLFTEDSAETAELGPLVSDIDCDCLHAGRSISRACSPVWRQRDSTKSKRQRLADKGRGTGNTRCNVPCTWRS